MNARDLIRKWKEADVRPDQTSDPELLAGLYLEWAREDIQYAIRTVESHACGRYVDRPRFPGCDEALALLRKLEQEEQAVKDG
jgi:hypothetical protein